jgi:hypothetical protein
MLQLPNLDDRRWIDLVEDARALIPQLAPEWTDHNVHDPGITVMELLASIAELDIYQLNQISDRHRRKFLELVGIQPQPPRAARGAVAFRLAAGAPSLHLPAGVELVESERDEEPIPVRTLSSLDVLPVALRAVLAGTENGLLDLSARYAGRGAAIGPAPPVFRSGSSGSQALYLGFDMTGTPAAHARLHLYVAFEGPGTGVEARQRVIDERRDAALACAEPSDRCPPRCDTVDRSREREASSPPPAAPLCHYSVRTTWEYWNGARAGWEPVEALDDTRQFTLDGTVVIAVPDGWTERVLGSVSEPLFYVRCRLDSGEFDVPPVLRVIATNTVEVEQATAVWQRWKIAPAAVITGTAPAPGGESGLRLHIGEGGRIDALAFVDEAPRLTILEFAKSAGAEGRLTLEAIAAGVASGTPHLRVILSRRPVVASTLRLLSQEGDGWRQWERRPDFYSSRRKDAHHLLDPTRGVITFGDGEHGRVAPDRARLFAAYSATLAELGNFPAAISFNLGDSPRNRALLGDVQAARQRLAGVTSPVPATGGQAAETLAHAIGRAIDERESSLRAVTLTDYETLARQTPGAQVARASARANLRPGFPCVSAGGHVSVLIVPASGAARPVPSRGLRGAVLRYLQRRRVIGTRVEVVGPEYVEVAVKAKLAAFPRLNKQDVIARAVEAVNRFFHPLSGGPAGTGWPFGRDVYRSEILEILDGTDGVDRVESMELIVNDCKRQCGNVCLPPNGLVAAGRHQIEVV